MSEYRLGPIPSSGKRSFFSRRIVQLVLLQFILLMLPVRLLAGEPAAFSDWAKTARIAGSAAWTGMEPSEINTVLTNMIAQNVTVIEADSDLSMYLTDAEFEQELALMRDFATAAHSRNLRVVWYYPTLEVLTANGVNLANTMYKDHPDWIQISLDGQPNVFYGGAGRVFWVEDGMESAWMSPSSPYKDYYLNRIGRIAATGIDGLWLDVPLLNDIGVTWTDINPYAQAEFLADTGLTVPVAVNWSDPVFRRWIAWRHEQLAAFLQSVSDACRSVNPDFPIIVETVTMDYNAGTSIGLDGTYLKTLEGMTHVWEIDALSDNNAMRKAREDDWISLIAMNKYSRAASGTKPAWVFTYGKQANDAELVMAEALAAGNNPYETKIPEMCTTVGAAYRTKMFGWIKDNSTYLYNTATAARVAVLYSSPSRDYVDKAAGLGLYVTTTSSDALWWSTDAIDSAKKRQYLAEYRGLVKALVHTHTPFDIAVNQGLTLAQLSPYDVVMLPDVEAISDTDAALLRQYVWNGGKLIVTGPNPTGLDEYGTARPEYALSDLLGFSKGSTLPAAYAHAYGVGEVLFYSALLGKSYFVSTDANALATLTSALQQASTNPITTDADRRVHFELTQTSSALVLQLVNFIGVTGTFTVVPTSFTVSLQIPAGKQVLGVGVTSPDQTVPALTPLSYSVSGQSVSFTVSLTEYSMILVSLGTSVNCTDADGDGYYLEGGPCGAVDCNDGNYYVNPGVPEVCDDTIDNNCNGQIDANDSACDNPPVADSQALTTAEDTTAEILLVASDVDGGSLAYYVLASPAHGTLSGTLPNLQYLPAANYHGSDSFSFKAYDGILYSNEAVVSITISSVNDAPVFTADSIVGLPATVGIAYSGTLAGTAADVDGDALSFSIVSGPAWLSVASGGALSGTPGAADVGQQSWTVAISDGNGGSDQAVLNILVKEYAPVPVEKSFVAIAAEDGWVREKSETGAVGSTIGSDGTGAQGIRMGDDASDRQYKSILSFDTSAIPEGVTIVSAKLKLTRGTNSGTNPFQTHGTCLVDIKNGYFGGGSALAAEDFQAQASAEKIAVITDPGANLTVSETALDASALQYINTAGRTQLRLYFSLDDNDDLGQDLAGFYSANNGTATRRPVLIVVYQE